MDLKTDEFKKRFPHLAEEFDNDKMILRIDSVTSPNKARSIRLQGYTPNVIDFLQRCDDADQGREIITFLQKHGKITTEYAKQLRAQLHQKGIRSFGAKKEDEYYLKQDDR